MRRPILIVLACAAAAACGGDDARTHGPLTGCEGAASSFVPADGAYYLTTFGATTDSGIMSCGSDTDHGTWYYAQR